MKKVIICEKPSLAKNIKNALSSMEAFKAMEFKCKGDKVSISKLIFAGSTERKTAFYESDSYIITNAFGHLYSIGTMDDYVPDGVNGWSLSALPIIPSQFTLMLAEDNGIKKQVEMISYLINRDDVNEVVNCGDADREGELIVRNILTELNNTKYVSRLWLPEQTEHSILSAMDNLKADSDYDNLAKEGKARTYIDWLFGFNFSRYIILKTGIKGGGFNAGRVVIPIVEELYNREMQIKNFKSEAYYQLEGSFSKNNIDVKLYDTEKYDKDHKEQAEVACALLNSNETIVSNVTKKDVVLSSGKLFSLDKLQGKLAKDFDMPMETSLKVIQKLYESGYLTYPRTNTEYLAVAEQDKVKKLIEKFTATGKNLIMKTTKTIFDDSKVESHSALCPTDVTPTDLSGDEQKVYQTVVNRFCAVFATDCIVERTSVTLENSQHNFSLKGDVMKQLGFQEYEPKKKTADNTEQPLPMLTIGEKVPAVFEVKTKATKAPSRYSVDSFNDFLKCPYKADLNDEKTDDEEYRLMLLGCEIGTPATRTSIITNAIKKYKYISIKKNQYYCEQKGMDFINYLKDLKIDLFKDRNIDFNCMLKDVYRGEKSIDEVIAETANEIRNTMNKDIIVKTAEGYSSKDIIGSCPFCHKEIREGKSNYFCSGYKEGCTFAVWTECYCEFSFEKDGETITYTKKIKLTKTNVKDLLAKQKTLVRNVPEKSGTGEYYVRVEFSPDGRNKLISEGRKAKKFSKSK